MSTLNYSIANDTLNGAVAFAKLVNEIRALGITIALEGISDSGDVLIIEFRDTIQSADILLVDAAVAAHDGNPGLDDPQRTVITTLNGNDEFAYDEANDRIKVDVSGSLSDGTVKVSANDSTSDVLENKIISGGSDISITTLNDGGDEDLQISLVPANINTDDLNNDAGFLNESSHDSLPFDNPHNVDKLQVGLGNVPNVDATDADNVVVDALGNLTSTNVQAALEELQTDIDGLSSSMVTDHGALTGLLDDDHPQYLNEGRHDNLPQDNPHTVTFTQAVSADANTDITASEAESLTDGSNADSLHVHTSSAITDFNSAASAAAPVQPSDIADFETTTQLNARDVANRDRANHTGTQLSSTISDFTSAVQSSETTTTLSFNNTTKILSYTNEDGTVVDVDLTQFLDDTNLARIVSGTLDSGTGIATFTRDDNTTFTVDFSSLNDQAAIAAAIAAHEALPDPHPQYTTTAEAAAAAPVQPADIADFETSTQLDARDTANRNRANHTGTQLSSTISDFNAAASAAAPVQSVNSQTGNVNLGQNDLNDTVVTAPSNGQILEYNGTNWVNVTPASSGEFVVTQNGHGFSITNNIPLPAYTDTSGVVQLAQANSLNTLSAYFITEILDANNFVIKAGGEFFEATSHGLSVGRYYFLSETTAGGITIAEPLASINDVVFFVIDPDNLLLIDNRPEDKNSIEKFLIKTRNTNTTTNINQTAFTEVPLTGNTAINENSFYTVVGNGIQVPQTRSYKLKASVHIETNGTRNALRLQFAINGTPQGDIAATGYVRNSTGHNEASYHLDEVFVLNANDIVTVEAIRESTNATSTVLSEIGTSSLTVEAR